MKLKEGLQRDIRHFSFDMFYYGVAPDVDPDFYDFDHPSSLDFDAAYECIKKLKNKQVANIPIYDFVTHSRSKTETTIAQPASVVIVEGILAFHDPRIRDLMDLRVFVRVEPDEALCRRRKHPSTS